MGEAKRIGRVAERLAKRGIKGEPDLRIGGKALLPALAWENWIKRPGKKRRSVRLVVLLEEDFWKLLDKDKYGDYGYLVQAKSTQALSVRTVMEELIEAIQKGGYDG